MKTTMEKDTILFISSENWGMGLNYTYYQGNYHKIANKITDPINIYYKVGDTSDTWIDLDRAVALLDGTFADRIQQAFQREEFRVRDLKLIPQCEYHDAKGRIHQISPYDGQYDASLWVDRIDMDYNYSYTVEGNNLYIKFDSSCDIDLKNSMISLNGLFSNYKIIGTHTIKYLNIVDQLYINQINFTNMTLTEVKDEILRLQEKMRIGVASESDINRLNNLIQSQYKEYTVNIKVYTWKNILKSPVISPRIRIGEWITLDKMIDENCFVIYKGQILEYELSATQKNNIRLKDVPLENLEMFELGKLQVYQMTCSEPNQVIKKYISKGINNRFRNTVDFVLPIKNSLVVYEGLDHEYEILDEATVLYPGTRFSPSYVNDKSLIYQVNFTNVG